MSRHRLHFTRWIVIALGLIAGGVLGDSSPSRQAGDQFVVDYDLDINGDGIQDFKLKGLFKVYLVDNPISGPELVASPLDYWVELSPTAHPTNAFILPRNVERSYGPIVFTVDWLDDQCTVVKEMSPWVRFMSGDGVHYGTLLIFTMPPREPGGPDFHEISVLGYNPVPNEGFIAFDPTPPLVIRIDPTSVPPVIRWYGDRSQQQGTKNLESLSPSRDGVWISLGPPTSGREWRLDQIPTNSLYRVVSR